MPVSFIFYCFIPIKGLRCRRKGATRNLRLHRRHVAGRAARRKAGRPPGSYPRYDLSVRPEPWRRPSSLAKRPATGRWRTSMRSCAADPSRQRKQRSADSRAPGKTVTDAATPGWRAFFLARVRRLQTYFPASCRVGRMSDGISRTDHASFILLSERLLSRQGFRRFPLGKEGIFSCLWARMALPCRKLPLSDCWFPLAHILPLSYPSLCKR